jgi:hypothetical protein
MRTDMSIASDRPKMRHLALALATISALALIHPAASRADDAGIYAGRSLPSGLPANTPKDQAQLALEPGSAAVGGDATRLEGQRIFAGYRMAPGLALEGAQIRSGASNLGTSNETIVVTGVGSVPLSDSVTLVSKLGVNYQTSAFAGSSASLSEVTGAGRVYGLGVSVQVRDNVEVRAQTEHLGRPASAGQGPAASDSVLLGANVRF